MVVHGDAARDVSHIEGRQQAMTESVDGCIDSSSTHVPIHAQWINGGGARL